MHNGIAAIIRRLARPLAPEPTGQTPVLPPLTGVRAVLFDVYGTLFISASGDVGATNLRHGGRAFTEAAGLCGLIDPPDGTAAATRLEQAIEERHQAAHDEGIASPEVEILEVWRDVFDSLCDDVPDETVLRRFATVYENLVNPVWSMPGCREMLERLRDDGFLLGLVSNAQFYTLPLFEALLGTTPEELGIRDDLIQVSYRCGRAKPGVFLYEQAAIALAELGVTPAETLMVGNDLLNDVTPAAAVGFRTVLFAGDRRSLRLRQDDDRVAGVEPTAVITELRQLPDLLEKIHS